MYTVDESAVEQIKELRAAHRSGPDRGSGTGREVGSCGTVGKHDVRAQRNARGPGATAMRAKSSLPEAATAPNVVPEAGTVELIP
jgi:hypothetical protein